MLAVTLPAIAHWSAAAYDESIPGWLQTAWRDIWQSSIFIAIVWCICRAFPKLPASVRCSLWWLASLKLLLGLVWTTPLDLPVLRPTLLRTPAAVAVRPMPARTAAMETAAAFGNAQHLPTIAASTPHIAESRQTARMPIELSAAQSRETQSRPSVTGFFIKRLPILLAVAWLVGIMWRVMLLARQFSDSRRLLRTAHRIEGSWVRETGERIARRMHLSLVPLIFSSPEVTSPVVVGIVEPVILIPERDYYNYDNATLRLALAHEMAHVRRNDLWLGLVPSLAQAVFFFHPLAWLAGREYALCREEACDEEAIRLTGIAPTDYGKLLLRFGVAGRPSSMVVGLGATTNARLLKRRIEMLQHAGRMPRHIAALWLAIAITVGCAGLLPLRLVARQRALPAHRRPTPYAAPTRIAAALPCQTACRSTSIPVHPLRTTTPMQPIAPAVTLQPLSHPSVSIAMRQELPGTIKLVRLPNRNPTTPTHLIFVNADRSDAMPHPDSMSAEPMEPEIGMDMAAAALQEANQAMSDPDVQASIQQALRDRKSLTPKQRREIARELNDSTGSAAHAMRMAEEGISHAVDALQTQLADIDHQILALQSQKAIDDQPNRIRSLNNSDISSAVSELLRKRAALAQALSQAGNPDVRDALSGDIDALDRRIDLLNELHDAQSNPEVMQLRALEVQRKAISRALAGLQRNLARMKEEQQRGNSRANPGGGASVPVPTPAPVVPDNLPAAVSPMSLQHAQAIDSGKDASSSCRTLPDAHSAYTMASAPGFYAISNGFIVVVAGGNTPSSEGDNIQGSIIAQRPGKLLQSGYPWSTD